MTDNVTKPVAATGNVVEGFSQRFNYLLDRAKWSPKSRIAAGARRFDIAANTFKFWLMHDRIPGTHGALLEITEALLREIPGHYNPKSVVAWLLAGDAVPNPFESESKDTLKLLDLYMRIAEVAKRAGLDFNALPREARNTIVTRIQSLIPEPSDSDAVEFDKSTLTVLIGMLETAKAMTP